MFGMGMLNKNLVRSKYIDVLGDYVIDLSQKHDLANDFCTYYEARHIKNGNRAFAIVFGHKFLPDIEILEVLKNSNRTDIVCPIDYGIARLSYTNLCYLVVIVPQYEYHQTLRNISIDKATVEKSFAKWCINIVEFFAIHKIAYANITPDDVILLDNGGFLLRECFNAPHHFYNENMLLAPEMMGTIPIGRYAYDIKSSIYVAGIVIAYSYCGDKILAESNSEARLRHGSFETLIGRRYGLSESLRKLLKGMLEDSIDNRWGVHDIINWKNGVKQGAVHKAVDLHPISFNEQKYNNPRALAHAMFTNWDAAFNFMQDETLVKWLQKISGNGQPNEVLEKLMSEKKYGSVFLSSKREEDLFNILIALNRSLVMFIAKGIGFTIHSIPVMLLYGISEEREDLVDTIVKVVSGRLWARVVGNNQALPSRLEKLLENGKAHSNKLSLLYHMNPNIPCLSRVIAGEYVCNIPELLTILNRIIVRDHGDIAFDEHLLAFISNKLVEPPKYTLKAFADYAKLSRHNIIVMFPLIACAKKAYPDVEISNISSFLIHGIMGLLTENLYSVKVRKALIEEITELGENEELMKIMELLDNNKIYEHDSSGYSAASEELGLIKQEINSLRNIEYIEGAINTASQRLVVFASYMLCLMTTLIFIV